MNVLVKICGLGEKRHVDDAVAAGADAVGFVFAASKRRVSPAHARDISSDVPATVKRVAVMLHPSDDEWRAVLDGFGPDVLQTDAGDFAQLTVPEHVECWPVYREGGAKPPADVATYVYEGAVSGRGETVDWSGAAAIARRGRMILAGGLAAGNVAEAMATVRPWGVDVSSAVESEPGKKDSRLIVDFIEAARAAEREL